MNELLKISCIMFNFGKEKILWILLAPLEEQFRDSYRSLRGSIFKFFFKFHYCPYLETDLKRE